MNDLIFRFGDYAVTAPVAATMEEVVAADVVNRDYSLAVILGHQKERGVNVYASEFAGV